MLAVLGDRAAGPTLLLEGHTDVVTEGDPGQWSHPPFGADLVDGRIYGRGAADMKSGLAAIDRHQRASRVRGSRTPYMMSTKRFATTMITEVSTVIPITTE